MLGAKFSGCWHARYDFDWVIFQTMLGTVMFWVGVGLMLVALILVGVRSIAQQQLDILLQTQRELSEPDATVAPHGPSELLDS